MAGITEDVLQRVQTLTYVDFLDHKAGHKSGVGGASGGAQAERLEAWQVRHATLMLDMSPELVDLRFLVTPKYAVPVRIIWQ